MKINIKPVILTIVLVALLGSPAISQSELHAPTGTALDAPQKDANLKALALATQTIEGDSLKISVWDNCQMQVWKKQGEGWVNQIYGVNNKGFKLFFNQNNMAAYFSGNEPELVSNTMIDDFTIETKVRKDGVEVTQTVQYRNSNNYYTITWDIWNRTGAAIDSVKFFAGEDTYFAGSDYGQGYWDANNSMVYVKNTQGGETGIMGLYGAFTSPALSYYEDFYANVRTKVENGWLPNTVNPDNVDAGYALGWRKNNLEPDQIWTILARETFERVATDDEAPVVTLHSPNGGEIFNVGSSLTVEWSASDNIAVTRIDIRLSTDGGETYHQIGNLTSDLDFVTTYTWNDIPDSVASDNCKIKIIAYDAAFNFSEDESDDTFTIKPAQDTEAPVVYVRLPNGGERYQVGTDMQINWTATDNVSVIRVELQISTDHGETFSFIEDNATNNPPFVWTVPPSAVSENCKIKVIAYDAVGNFSSDESDAVFTIYDQVTKTVTTNYGPPSAPNTWQGFEIMLTAETFGIDEATFMQILSNVTMFRIRTEMHDGPDIGGLDDVQIGNRFASHFETNTEGWSAAGDGTMEWMSSGGIADGYLQISDWASGDWHWAVAPASWSGDWTALNGMTINFYFKTDQPSYGAVIEISSDEHSRLVLTADPLTIPPNGDTVVLVYVNPLSPEDVVVNLASSNPDCITVPADIVVTANNPYAKFKAYAVEGVENCSSVITASASGYGESRITLKVGEMANPNNGTLSGRVTDATTGNGIAGATVTVGGISTTTDENGNYSISDIPAGEITANFSGSPRSGTAPLTVQFTDLSGPGYQSLSASAEGYYSYDTSILLTAGLVTNFDISLSPTITEGEMRFVLNWGQTPLDLDLHLKTPQIEGNAYEVYYRALGSATSPPYAGLDHDDTDSFGPETITIYRFFDGMYKCFIHNYSRSPAITTSGGVVQIYGQSGLLHTIYVPTSGDGLYWYICDIDGSTGQVIIKNTIEGEPPTAVGLRTLMYTKKSNTAQIDALVSMTDINAWQWDFDNNGTIDATDKNPTFIYAYPGNYTVKLTVSDGTNTYTETKTEYITVSRETEPPVVALSSPNGGETYTAGSTIEITWTATDNSAVSRIDLQISTDEGSTYEAIATELANSSSYLWTIPSTLFSEVCKIKVIAYDSYNNSSEDESDEPFSIRFPYKQDYNIGFSTIDIGSFPTIKCFVSVIDTSSWGPVAGLAPDNVTIKEDHETVGSFTIEEVGSSSGAEADIVFVFDVTGSLEDEIAALKDRALRFADVLVAKGFDFRLGLVTFKDEVDEVHDFSTDANEFKAWIDGLVAEGGGDSKENALEGLARAANLSFRENAQRIAILITDADYHQAGESGDGTTGYTTENMIDLLAGKRIVTNVVGPDETQFHQIADLTGGVFYDINGDFQTIVDNIGTVISSQYLITYTSPNATADNSTRTVTVVVEHGDKGGFGTGSYTVGLPRLVMNPTLVIGIVNSSFTIDMDVESIVNLGLCHFIVTFDHTKIEAVDVSNGGFLEQGGATSSFVPNIDNSTGQVDVATTRMGTGGASGSGTICSVTFRVLAEDCTSDIDFTSVNLKTADEPPALIDVTTVGAHIDAASSSGVSNLLGDFDNDVDIDTRDFALLSTYWKPVNSATGDIGPATGTAPSLTPAPDGVVNFEDLFIFTRMWNWFHSAHVGTGGVTLAKSAAKLEWRISPTIAKGNQPRVELWVNGVDRLAMGHLLVRFDADLLIYKSSEAGPLLSENDATVAFIADQNDGLVDLAFARLAVEGQMAEVSGSAMLASLEFESKSFLRIPSISLDEFDLRNADNERLAVTNADELSLSDANLPNAYRLNQNYPNPFNSRTQIRFQIPSSSHVRVDIVNVLGQPVRTLVNERLDAGSHQIDWDGKNEIGREVISGIYIIRMQAGSFKQTKQMLFIK